MPCLRLCSSVWMGFFESRSCSFSSRIIPVPCRSLSFFAAWLIFWDATQLDFMVALGTHPPLSESDLCGLVGITHEERTTTYRCVGLFNHAWKDPLALV